MSFFVGQLAPVVIPFEISDGGDVDLSTVTAATLYVQKPSGAILAWVVTPVWDPPTLTLSYELDAVTSEFDETGTWLVYADLTIPAGFERTETVSFNVKTRFAR